MPTSSAMVICTLSTYLEFHTGSNRLFAKRSARMFWTVSLPR
jgi:hypothetical protein